MQTYHVSRDFAQNGRLHRQGDTVELTERQARYLLINGFVTVDPSKKPAVAGSAPEPKAATKTQARKKSQRKQAN